MSDHTLGSVRTDHAVDPPVPAATRSLRPVILRLHFYAGVLVAPFIAIAALTGALYAAAPTVERFVYRDVLTVEPAATSVSLDEQIASAQRAFPDLPMSGLRPAPTGTDSTRVYLTDPGLGADMARAVFVDPHTGQVLGDEATWLGYLPLSTWLDGLHRHLNLGEPGRVYSELAASWLWVVAVGGLYLWIVKVRRERRQGRVARAVLVDRGVSGRSRTVNWHGATGVWILAALVFLSATGITWSTYAGAKVTDLRTALNWERPQLDTALTPAIDANEHSGHTEHQDHGGAPPSPGLIDYDAVVDAATAAGVGAPFEVSVPAAPGQAAVVTEIDRPYRLTTDAAAVDPGTVSVAGRIDYWRDYSLVAKLADWGIRLHMGFLFGLLNQVLLLGVALSLLTVVARGYRMWWQRRPTRGSAWAVGRAPRRGGLRRLRPAASVAIVLTAAAVGWFLPLLGLSLVGFLAVDTLLAVVTSRRRGNRRMQRG